MYTIATIQTHAASIARDKGSKVVDAAQMLIALDNACREISVRTKLLRFNKTVSLVDGTGECYFYDDGTGLTSLFPGGKARIIDLKRDGVLWDTSTTNLGYWKLVVFEPNYDMLLRRIQGDWTKQSDPQIWSMNMVAQEPTGTSPNLTTKEGVWKFTIWPRPLTPLTNRLSLTGHRTHTEIDASTVTSGRLEFPPTAHKMVLYMTLVEYFMQDGRLELAAWAEKQYDRAATSLGLITKPAGVPDRLPTATRRFAPES